MQCLKNFIQFGLFFWKAIMYIVTVCHLFSFLVHCAKSKYRKREIIWHINSRLGFKKKKIDFY